MAYIAQVPPHPTLIIITLRPILRTKRHLNSLRAHPPSNQSLPKLTQPRRRINLTPILSRHRILSTTPQYLRGGGRSWPSLFIEVYFVDLFGPEVDFAAYH